MSTPELDLAFRYVQETSRNIFLTGKAGTGKTTFLRRVRRETLKRTAVVAPTGVAAINAKGMTIHSLFQLPFGNLTPERMETDMQYHRFNRKKEELLQSLDLLIIDEVSMVRVDVMDGIDRVLRRLRGVDRPFGGVQLLLIGDLHQLPPVVRNDDERELRQHWNSFYFFGSKALEQTGLHQIQLTHIFRQSDADFIDLLNHVRTDEADERVLAALNARYVPDFVPPEGEKYITLTSHNRAARDINEERLNQRQGEAHTFTAEVSGTFPESMYPNDETLTFKVGAQVMFNRNDSYPDPAYYNGKIGTITSVDKDKICVRCPGEDDLLEVTPVTWENRTYELDAGSREVEERTIGSYKQHPLRLAWAITIHKSQGLTFDRVIIDAGRAFAHGQVYVALSRCRTLEGIVLSTPIRNRSVRTDATVNAYTSAAEADPPDKERLRADKHAFQYDCLRELFTFGKLHGALLAAEQSLLSHERAIQGHGPQTFADVKTLLIDRGVAVANTFRHSLKTYAKDPTLPEAHAELQDRLRKAGAYFANLLDAQALRPLDTLQLLTDKKDVKQALDGRLRVLARHLFTKLQLFRQLTEGFDPNRYVRTRTDAITAFEKRKPYTTELSTDSPNAYTDGTLLERLNAWRQAVARSEKRPVYNVLPNKSLVAIADVLPLSKKILRRVPGFGRQKMDRYGDEVLRIVSDYLEEE